MKFTHSQNLFQEAQKHLVGGVNSPVRAFRGVGGDPIFIRRAKGANLWDADGNRYIDYVGSWGPMIFGHAPNFVLNAIRRAIRSGTSFGAPTSLEVDLARLVKKIFPSMEKIRFVSSGTEATMSAIRAARGFTGRHKVIKFDGGYHGHADHLLVKAGSGVATLGSPDSAGVPPAFASETLIASFHDIRSVEQLFQQFSGQIAAVIIEPILGNMGVIPPQDHFLQKLRELTTRAQSVLIFDEVMTGFRVALGGAQELYQIRPDLTCLGKIIGGGLPVGAYGGKKEILSCVAPEGPVYQAGTLSGNPVAMAAGLATLKALWEKRPYARLQKLTEQLTTGIMDLAKQRGIPLRINQVGSMWTPFFHGDVVTTVPTARKSDTKQFAHFFHRMLEEGVYLPPSQFETAFVSVAHTEREIDKTLKAVGTALEEP